MEREKIQLAAQILNSSKQIEVYEWLALIVPEYGNKPFNMSDIIVNVPCNHYLCKAQHLLINKAIKEQTT